MTHFEEKILPHFKVTIKLKKNEIVMLFWKELKSKPKKKRKNKQT